MTRQAIHYHRFRQAGKCPQCGGRPAPGRVLCALCGRKKSATTLIGYYRKKKQVST